ncbi:TraR/DksA C4-type zinc finger protein [Candidatus Gottesmanbacteria bacterium]|nr:TraR/DksA C4-type zinc finger protein [Candidatus Gottesmanbacteria bacterium]
MNQLSQQDIDTARILLEEEKKKLVSRVIELTAQDPFSDPDRLNDNAASDMEASEESNHDRFQAILDELKEKLGLLDGALLRIGNGTYGVCTSCGKPIEQNRLKILPTAVLCSLCEQKKK